MSKRTVSLRNRKQRSILTDMLPFEVPPTFSNFGFYCFLQKYNVEIDEGRVRWMADTDESDVAIKILFGIELPVAVDVETKTEWGKAKTLRSVSLGKCRMDTTPFNFRVAHGLDGRTLSVIHPRNQIEVASFYAKHHALMIYYASKSEISIRHPVSVSKFSYFRDSLHAKKLDPSKGLEQKNKEYEQLGSYFVYRKYRNIHGFFESYKYHRSEKKYDAMVQLDLSKCFDSIYTHSIAWAVLGKSQTKFDLKKTQGTFADRFDGLMQGLNQRETNGIVIGPEFSRIFAEIILQAADVDLVRRLRDQTNLHHKVDYEIFRYVDDYFIFYNAESTYLRVYEALQEVLRETKLSINGAKIKPYAKPLITEISIAKQGISRLLNEEIEPRNEAIENESDPDRPFIHFFCDVNANRLITRYKAVIKQTNVKYGDLLNYTLAIVENKIDRCIKLYIESDEEDRDRRRLVRGLLAVLEFGFFVYSASPKVNHTVRISRVASKCVDFLNDKGLSFELKHLLFKYIHDNVLQQIDKNVMGIYREVESLYLLTTLSKIGREYWLPEQTLLKHFRITINKTTGAYERDGFMSHFAITVLLSYIRDKVRYTDLRAFVRAHAVAKLQHAKAHCPKDAESVMLLLDLLVCPYVDVATKEALGQVFQIDLPELATLAQVNDRWFTAWGDKFDLLKELDAKRSREVY